MRLIVDLLDDGRFPLSVGAWPLYHANLPLPGAVCLALGRGARGAQRVLN
jgi:hypothetical protein